MICATKNCFVHLIIVVYCNLFYSKFYFFYFLYLIICWQGEYLIEAEKFHTEKFYLLILDYENSLPEDCKRVLSFSNKITYWFYVWSVPVHNFFMKHYSFIPSLYICIPIVCLFILFFILLIYLFIKFILIKFLWKVHKFNINFTNNMSFFIKDCKLFR